MKSLFALLFALTLSSQTPGTVTQATTSTVTGVSGSVTCVLSNTTPALPSGIHTECKVAGTVVLVLDSIVTTGNSGVVGSFTNAGNTITWIITKPAATGEYSWQMAANGTSKSGSF